MRSRFSRRLRIITFLVLPIVLVVAGWYTVIAQSQSLEQATIASYQAAQTEIVESTARATQIYITNELERRGSAAMPEIEQEVLQLFVQPVRVGTYGDAWIHTPEYVIFDASEDFPAEFIDKSIADVFEIRAAEEDASTRPRAYDALVAGIMQGQAGVTTYVWVANKAAEFTPWWEFATRDVGVEVAAWTPVEVFPDTAEERTWVVGLSSMLPELMHLNGAYDQINAAIIMMILVTAGTGALMVLLWHTERTLKTNEEHYQAIVEHQTELVARFRPDGTLTFVNDAFARYFGQPQATLVGQTIGDLPGDIGDTPDAHMRPGQAHQHDATPREQQVQFSATDSRWLLMNERPIRDSQGNLAEIQLVASDITARKQAEIDRAQAEQEQAVLQQQVIDVQQATLRELSTPLIPITDNVVIMPLIGTIDTQRAQQIMEALLEGVAQQQAELAIVDITGVSIVDTQVAQALISAAQAVRLLGAQVMLTGIQPQIAQTLVHLGVDLGSIQTHGSLQAGIAVALAHKDARQNGRRTAMV
jgi:anti-anti-sigma factor